MKRITFDIKLQPKGFDAPVMAWAKGYQAAPGLAVARAHTVYPGWDGKTILEQHGSWFVYHIASGMCIGDELDNRAQAERYALGLAAILDWTQDAEVIREQGRLMTPTLQMQRAECYRVAKYEPEPEQPEPPRPLPVVLVPGGFSVRGKELYASLKGTKGTVHFAGIDVNPGTLREVARLHPMLEVRPKPGQIALTTPDGRTRMHILNGAGCGRNGPDAPLAEIRPMVHYINRPRPALAPAAD